jgi:hypothetical protein
LGECAAVYKNNTHTIKELQQEILAAMISICEETPPAKLCYISDVNNRWSWVPVVQILKMFLYGFHSPKTAELTDIKDIDACNVVR